LELNVCTNKIINCIYNAPFIQLAQCVLKTLKLKLEIVSPNVTAKLTNIFPE